MSSERIVERLRWRGERARQAKLQFIPSVIQELDEAADEIERLRAENDRLLDLIETTDLPGGALRAAAALEGDQP